MYPYPDAPTYNQFLETVLMQQVVYTLINDEDDLAECPSTEYDGDDGEPIPVYCIWATAQAAQACQTEEWANHQLETVLLTEFMSDWLMNMEAEGVLVGVDFDSELYGIEIEPIELLGDLMDAAAHHHLDLALENQHELMKYRLEWERLAAGQNHLN